MANIIPHFSKNANKTNHSPTEWQGQFNRKELPLSLSLHRKNRSGVSTTADRLTVVGYMGYNLSYWILHTMSSTMCVTCVVAWDIHVFFCLNIILDSDFWIHFWSLSIYLQIYHKSLKFPIDTRSKNNTKISRITHLPPYSYPMRSLLSTVRSHKSCRSRFEGRLRLSSAKKSRFRITDILCSSAVSIECFWKSL